MFKLFLLFRNNVNGTRIVLESPIRGVKIVTNLLKLFKIPSFLAIL